MGVTASLKASARDLWRASAARFGQTRALTNARGAATGMSRDRVNREEVRLYLEGLDEESADVAERRAAAASDS